MSSSPYRVLTTPTFEREIRKLTQRNPQIIKHFDRMIKVLRSDPWNRTRSHNIRQLKEVEPGEGQLRIRSGEWRMRYDITGQDVILHSFRLMP